jgi:hypothetical protein
VLLYDIWRILEGDQRDEVSIDDLKTIIMAIVKITDHKRININPTEEEKEHIQRQQIGFFNNKG